MSETVYESFDPACLPAWARKRPAVVARTERNLAFRCEVFRAETAQYKRFLIREAERHAHETA